MRKGQRLQTLRTSTWKPPTWKNGSTACHKPRPRTRPESTRFDAFDASTRLPQVSSAALGLPVVPEVNMMRARWLESKTWAARSAKWMASSTEPPRESSTRPARSLRRSELHTASKSLGSPAASTV